MNNFVIYKHTSPSGKVYIGLTCLKPEYRWNSGKKYKECTYFYKAILKYGWDNFNHEILFTGLDLLNANIIEEDLIYYYKLLGISYNLLNGGNNKSGWHHTPEAIEKTRQAKLGKPRSEETKEKIRLAHLGMKLSPETIEKRAQKNRVPIILLSKEGNFIQEWRSAKDAGDELGICKNNITNCCRGKKKTCGGYIWKYKKDYGSN